MVVTEDEFLEWKQMSITKQFFSNLKQKREELKEHIVHNAYENDEFAKGKVMALLELIEMNYEQFMEECSRDGKH